MRSTARLRARRVAGALLALTLLVLAACDGSFWAASPRAPVVGPGCPAWTARQSQPNIAAPGSTDPVSLAQFNQQLVNQTIRPITNPYALTQRLVTHQSSTIACTAKTTPAGEQVGDELSFWIANSNGSGYRSVRARLDYVTPLLYVYVQDGATVDELALKSAADQFSTTVYDAERSQFGQQWNLGPNHDGHITLLNVTGLGSTNGYFSPRDEYPTVVSPFSNARQMLYLNLIGANEPGEPTYQATITAVFEQMIHWWRRPQDPTWIDAGMSALAQQLNKLPTSDAQRAWQAWLNAPQTPLIPVGTNVSQASAGVSYAFMDYLYQRYGGAAFLRDFMGGSQQEPQAIDSALARQKSRDTFAQAYANFIIAALLNDPNIAQGGYSFSALPGARARLTGTIGSYPYASSTASLAQYGVAYYDVRPPTTAADAPATSRPLTITFAGAPTTTILPNTPYNGVSAEWWSNSGDNMDSTLTRTLDLTDANLTPTPTVKPSKTPAATPTPAPTATPNPTPAPVIMTFAAWYNLQRDRDYTYVEVSTDNGSTWTTLPATTSTDANPNGRNLGHGITGSSNGWVMESVNLTAYSGKKIQIRFETVTDDAIHGAGFALDDIQIPAINLSDDASAGGSWVSNGWVRSNNVLPQSWIVEAVVFHANSAAPTIQRVNVNATTGAGSVTFSGFGVSVTHVELAITPVTWGSFVSAPYQLTATAV